MNIRPKKYALFGNTYQAKKSAHVLQLLSILDKYQAEVYIQKEFHQFLTKDQKMDIQVAGVFENDDFSADMVLSMGGDGTFLKAASYVGHKNIPILGINTGRLGFLADVSPEEMEDTFEDIFIKRQPDPETGNTFPDRNQHCQLGGSHDQHNEKQEFKKSPAQCKNSDHTGKFHNF